jgi:hypothetical protein
VLPIKMKARLHQIGVKFKIDMAAIEFNIFKSS